jgi:protein-S-isoprenylcysteine O-methyltransferase Ste14
MADKKPLPPTYFWTSVIIMVVLHFALPIITLIKSPYRYLGIIPILIGLWVNLWCSSYFDKVKTTVKPFREPTYFITEGFFKYSRHPMYLGMLLALIGLNIILGSLSPVIVIFVYIWLMTKRFILIEEQDMERKFGAEYVAYRQRVRRWL